MSYLWASILIIVNAALLLLNLLGLPGNWLMLAATFLFAWWRWSERTFSIWTLAAVLGLALMGELLELLAGMLGAKAGGSSKRGGWGALLGGLAGALVGTFVIPIPVVGSLAGGTVGACVGALTMEMSGGRAAAPAMKIGATAAVGRLLGIAAKLGFGILIWLIIAIAAFVP